VEAFCAAVPGRYVPVSDAALRLGTRLWAQARRAGTPTAAPSELDGDVLLAAQALTLDLPAADRVIATTNVGYLAQCVAAALWTQITPSQRQLLRVLAWATSSRAMALLLFRKPVDLATGSSHNMQTILLRR